MISEIMHRFDLFEENTINIKETILLKLLREGFQNIHGPLDNSVVIQFIESKKISKHDHNTILRDLDKQATRHKWFKLNDTAFGTVILSQDQNRPGNRRYQIKLIEDGFISRKDMVPFIKFYSNPQGILMIERIMFTYV
jgi:hypothetical protein